MRFGVLVSSANVWITHFNRQLTSSLFKFSSSTFFTFVWRSLFLVVVDSYININLGNGSQTKNVAVTAHFHT